MRYVVELDYAFQVVTKEGAAEFVESTIARVYEKADGWPTKREKPAIKLLGSGPADAADQVRIWLASGAVKP